jgi:hypothetical protein
MKSFSDESLLLQVSIISTCDRFLLFTVFTVLSRILKINLGSLGPLGLLWDEGPVALLSLLLSTEVATLLLMLLIGDLTGFIGGFGSFNFNLSAFSDLARAASRSGWG